MNPESANVKPDTNLIQEKVDTISTQQIANSAEAIPETEKEINWKKFKEERRKEREAAEAMAKKAEQREQEVAAYKAAMEAMLNKPQPNQQSINNGSQYEEEETEDQRIEKKVQAMLSKREAEAEKKRAERELQEFPQRLNQHHPDFNQVCNNENLEYLEFHYPEVAQAFKHMPDGYDKWSTVYKAVKRFVPNTDTRKDSAKIEKNLAKPGSISSPGTAQGGNAMPGSRLDEAKKAENWKRMEAVRKGLS